jgi:ATP-dependent Clp protease ATP-binding subunit ClpB
VDQDPREQDPGAGVRAAAQSRTRLKEHIVGQDEAVAAVAAAIRRSRVGISPKQRPVSFIFVGSTGVGKTELVKCLANELFDSVESLIRLDMSEYHGKAQRLQDHRLASRLRRLRRGRPAHREDPPQARTPSCCSTSSRRRTRTSLNILLQILDDGRITDAQGRVVNFENTIIIMTSNAGSDRKDGSVGFGRSLSEQSREKAIKALGEFLRPEFINRVDEVVCFNKLTEENFRGIAGIMLRELQTSLEARAIEFSWDDSLVGYLVRKSYSVAYGARNLRRTIQKDVEDPIAERIIDSFVSPLHKVSVRAEDDKVVLTTDQAQLAN